MFFLSYIFNLVLILWKLASVNYNKVSFLLELLYFMDVVYVIFSSLIWWHGCCLTPISSLLFIFLFSVSIPITFITSSNYMFFRRIWNEHFLYIIVISALVSISLVSLIFYIFFLKSFGFDQIFKKKTLKKAHCNKMKNFFNPYTITITVFPRLTALGVFTKINLERGEGRAFNPVERLGQKQYVCLRLLDRPC